MSQNQSIPNFIIVGAPKCGTTALDYHLNLHPEIFMAKKEIHFFGSDLGMIQEPLDKDKYLSFFNDAKTNQLKGESSVWYLYSKLAAKEIKEFNPNCKIIILLRNPFEMLPSLHGQYIFNGIEDIKDFNQALFSDINNQNKTPCNLFKDRPKYIESVLYKHQVERFKDSFNNDELLILLHEELKSNFLETYKKTLNFLGVNDTDFEPDVKKINMRKEVTNITLHQLSKSPPNTLKKVFRTIVPIKSVRHSIMQWSENINVSNAKEISVSTESFKQIKEQTKEDVDALEKLINKDLSNWLT